MYNIILLIINRHIQIDRSIGKMQLFDSKKYFILMLSFFIFILSNYYCFVNLILYTNIIILN